MKTMIIEGERVRIHCNNIIVKRGYYYFEYQLYEDVKDDDLLFGSKRFNYGKWLNCSVRLTDLINRSQPETPVTIN